MPNYKTGQNFKLYVGPNASKSLIGAVKTLGGTYSISEVDITNKDSAGYRELLAGGIKSLDLTVAGIYSDDANFETLRSNFHSGAVTEYTLEFPIFDSGNTTNAYYEAKFKVTELSIPDTDEGSEAVQFSATLLSSGTITFSAEAL